MHSRTCTLVHAISSKPHHSAIRQPHQSLLLQFHTRHKAQTHTWSHISFLDFSTSPPHSLFSPCFSPYREATASPGLESTGHLSDEPILYYLEMKSTVTSAHIIYNNVGLLKKKGSERLSFWNRQMFFYFTAGVLCIMFEKSRISSLARGVNWFILRSVINNWLIVNMVIREADSVPVDVVLEGEKTSVAASI